MQNLAARRALTSTGVIGLSALLLTKLFDIDLKVSLPIGMATGLTVDYLQNMNTYKHAVNVVSHRMRTYQDKISDSPFVDSLMVVVFALLSMTNAHVVVGRYRDLFALPPPPPPDDDDDDDEDGPPDQVH